MHAQHTACDPTERGSHYLFAEAYLPGLDAPESAVAAVLWPPAVPYRPFLWPPSPPSLDRVAPASPAAFVWGVWPPGSTTDAAPYGPYWCEVWPEFASFAWTVTDSWTGCILARGRSSDRASAMARAALTALIAGPASPPPGRSRPSP